MVDDRETMVYLGLLFDGMCRIYLFDDQSGEQKELNLKPVRFIPILAAVAIILVFVGYLVVEYLILQQRSFAAVGIATAIAFFPTIIAYTLTYSGLDKSTTGFIGLLLTGMFAKMVIGIMAIVVVALRFRPVRDEFVVTYIIAYFLFTGFEVYSLLRKLRPKF